MCHSPDLLDKVGQHGALYVLDTLLVLQSKLL